MDKSAVGHEHHEELEKHSSQTDAAKGFGGKYGVQKERIDKSAVGFDYKAQVERHGSQQDAAKGFGGKYGVQKERIDKSALGFDYKEQLQKHCSQQDHSQGFGGKFGVQKDRQDKSALSWSHKEELKPHESQTDHSQGFGGKFGVQKDRQDKSALSWSHKEETKPHESQTDYAKGFGGRYGIQTDRVDKCASGFGEIESPSSAYEKTQPLEAMTSGTHNLRSRFENIAQTAEEENRQRAEEERIRREKKDRMDREVKFKTETYQSAGDELAQRCPDSIPVPKPRVSAVTPPQSKKEIKLDPEYEAPPILPPILPGLQTKVLTTAHENYEKMEEMYEDITVLPSNTEDDYEAIPDLPSRSLEEDNEDYDNVIVPETDNGLYEELPKEEGPVLTVSSSSQKEGPGMTAIAIYDYEGGADDEISFQPRDLITDIEMLDEGWWSGTCRGHRGLFPANYVELVQ
ncbi:hypothetical protein GDO86_006082 [Hymenochirus boettgeri]|uniref:SH3 domain-containing protein n=1 Tax=Hymenochirus boettgeri TaxID=247094 RepID=A0A8T2JCG8_9PIPI|nr:hypothetical protein GDO86_006082 [Hymenochirus boettgeri]